MNFKVKVSFSDIAYFSWVDNVFGIRRGKDCKVIIRCRIVNRDNTYGSFSINMEMAVPENLAEALFNEIDEIQATTKAAEIQRASTEHPNKSLDFYNSWLTNAAFHDHRPLLEKVTEKLTECVSKFFVDALQNHYMPDDLIKDLREYEQVSGINMLVSPCRVELVQDELIIDDIDQPFVMVSYRENNSITRVTGLCQYFSPVEIQKFSLVEDDLNLVLAVVQKISTEENTVEAHKRYLDIHAHVTKDLIKGEYKTDASSILLPMLRATKIAFEGHGNIQNNVQNMLTSIV